MLENVIHLCILPMLLVEWVAMQLARYLATCFLTFYCNSYSFLSFKIFIYVFLVVDILAYYFFKGVHVKFSQPLYSTLESSGKLHGTLISSEPLKKIYQIRLKLISGNATSKCKGHYWRYIATLLIHRQ